MPGKVRSPGNGLPDFFDYTSFESSAGRLSAFKQTRQKAKKDAHAATTELCAAGRLSEFKQARRKAKKVHTRRLHSSVRSRLLTTRSFA